MNTFKIGASAVGLAILALGATPAAAKPSFSCRGALNAAERTICRNQALAALDRELAYWYRRAKLRAGYFDQTSWLRSEQRSWLSSRNSCGSDVLCIRVEYIERINTLQNYAEHV